MGPTSVSVSVDRATELIRVQFTGNLTKETLREGSRNACCLPEFGQGWKLLVDLASVAAVNVPSELIVALAESAQVDSNRIAFVAPRVAVYGLARMYEIVADPGETRICVFLDEDSAPQWLTTVARA